MSRLVFGPKGLFTARTYSIARDGEPVGEIVCSRLWEQATITIGAASYTAAREGKIIGAFYLAANGNRLASAEIASALKGGFTVQAGGRTYTLKTASLFGRAFVLIEKDMEVGRIARRGFFSGKSIADLPDDLALEIKAFVIWLVIVVSRRLAQIGVTAAITSGR
jgi:hypothetical protein